MKLPTTPPAWAIRISKLLQEIEKLTGDVMYPVKVEDVAVNVSEHFFPDSPITKISGEEFSGGFEGMLHRVPNTTDEWGIVYNTARSPGQINFTMAHELGHYLLHRAALEKGVIQCRRRDMFCWDSQYGQQEAEANEFASYLLMPRNLFDEIMKGETLSLHLLQHVANHFEVSLTAAILKWLKFTNKRAMLVVGKDGFIEWVWHSEPLMKSGVFLQPKKNLIEIPSQSFAVKNEPFFDSMTGDTHEIGVWPFKEPVREMTLNADTYDMTITLLLFSDHAPSRWENNEEEPEPFDSFDNFVNFEKRMNS